MTFTGGEQKALWGVAILAVVLAGVVFFANPSAEPSKQAPQPVQSPDDEATEGWQTYRNEKYGFEVKYPAWFVQKTDEPIVKFVQIYETFTPGPDVPEGAPSRIARLRMKASLYIGEPAGDSGNEVRRIIQDQNFSIGPLPARKTVNRDEHTQYSADVRFFANDRIFSISLEWGAENDGFSDPIVRQAKKEALEAFDKILSTFRFIEENRVSESQKTEPVSGGDAVLIGGVPSTVVQLCSRSTEFTFVTDGGYQASFRAPAGGANRCESGSYWRVYEKGALPESGEFYFDQWGNFLGVCQKLFRQEVCQKYQHLNCEPKNFCAN